MKLSDFLEMYTLCRMPVIVFAYDSAFDEIWDCIDEQKPLTEWAYSPEFCIMPEFSQFKAKAYIKEKYANAKVIHFTIVKEGMIIFVEVNENVCT